MNGKAKVWLIVAILLILIGCILFSGVMMNMKWDFSKLSTTHYETNQYAITDSFTHIRITTGTADMVFVPSTDGTVSVECYEQTNIRHSVAVEDGTLSVELRDTRKWYEYIGLDFGSPKITMYLPGGAYGALTVKGSTGDVDIPRDFTFAGVDIAVSTGDVTNRASAEESIHIHATTGDIDVADVSAAALDLSVSTGRITVSAVTCEGDMSVRVSTGKSELTDVRCQNLVSSGNTGNLSLKNVVAAETISVVRTTGDITFDGCDATALSITTDTGDVKGSLLADKIFITKTDTGRVNVPATAVGGKCEITTDTGDITVTIQ